jgi:predicted PurR-regulated permease PerM
MATPVSEHRPDIVDHALVDRKSVDHDRVTASFVDLAVRLGVLGLLLYWAVVLVSPFLDLAIWSAVIAVALHPAYEWLTRRLGGRRRLAAALITILSLLVVIGPATWLALGLIESVRIITERLDMSSLPIPAPPQSIKHWPLIGDELYQFWDLASTNLTAAFAKIAPQLKPLGAGLLGIAANAGTATIKFFASIVVAGFLLSSAPAIVDGVRMASRRLSTRGEAFIHLAAATIRTVARGVIGVSALQAVLAGIGLVVAGVPGATLITSAVLVFGIIQIGPSVVLIPVIIWTWFAMDTTAALAFTAYMVPVNLLDNVLKPLVMGRGLKTPMLVILIGVIAGTLAHGMTGLFLGPIVLAVMWELLVAWARERPGTTAGGT